MFSCFISFSGLRVLLRGALGRARETAPAAIPCDGWTGRGVCSSTHLQPLLFSSPAPLFSSQNPNHRIQQQAVVSYRARKLTQRETLEQYGSGSHKLFYFELHPAVSRGKQHSWEQQTVVTCLS